MLRRCPERGNDAIIVVVRVRCRLGKPHDLLGIHGLAVDHGADLAVAPARVKAYAAAVKVSSRRPGRILRFRQLFGIDDLKRPFIYMGEIVPVKRLAAVCAEAFTDILTHFPVAADIHAPAALHPQHGLDETADIISVSLDSVGRAVDKRMDGCHLAAAALHGDSNGLLCRCKKCVVELIEREKVTVKLRKISDACLDAEIIHAAHPPYTEILCYEACDIFIISCLCVPVTKK